MSEFKDFDIEIQDNKEATPEFFEGSVATAGTPVTITPTTTRKIQEALVINQRRGPNANGINDLLFVTVDTETVSTTVQRGGSLRINGVFDELKIDSNNNGVNYEVILRS